MPDLESVIAKSLEGVEGREETGVGGANESETGDGGQDDQIEAPEGAGEVAEAGEKGAKDGEKAPAVVQEEDMFAKEHGLDQPKPGQRENRIPYSRVQKIVGNAEAKLVKAITGADLPAGSTVQDVVTRFATTVKDDRTKITNYESELQGLNAIGEIMATDPARFLEILVEAHPHYKALIGGNGHVATPVVSKDMPQPNHDLGEGKRTYDVEGLQKLREWDREQTIKAVEEKLGKRFKPFEDREADERARRENAPRVEAIMSEARTNWKGFKDHEADILKLLQEDRQEAERTRGRTKHTLESAYRQIVLPRLEAKWEEEKKALTATEATLREKILKEINDTPNSTSVVTGVAAKKVTDPTKPRDMEDVIRDSIKHLKR